MIDTFGTEPAYNHEEYATLHGFRTNWGYWNLHGQQYMTMFRKCRPSSPCSARKRACLWNACAWAYVRQADCTSPQAVTVEVFWSSNGPENESPTAARVQMLLGATCCDQPPSAARTHPRRSRRYGRNLCCLSSSSVDSATMGYPCCFPKHCFRRGWYRKKAFISCLKIAREDCYSVLVLLDMFGL